MVIGIDPGDKGCFTAMNADGSVKDSMLMPTIGKGRKSVIDATEIRRFLVEHQPDHVVIEDVHAKFGSSAGATFKYGYGCGLIEGVVLGLGFALTKVPPKQWQKEMWTGVNKVEIPSSTGKTKVVDTKATSLIAAKRLFPKEPFLPTKLHKKPHDGMVDSYLVAEYGRRNYL